MFSRYEIKIVKNKKKICKKKNYFKLKQKQCLLIYKKVLKQISIKCKTDMKYKLLKNIQERKTISNKCSNKSQLNIKQK